jgi:hypothetical protein
MVATSSTKGSSSSSSSSLFEKQSPQKEQPGLEPPTPRTPPPSAIKTPMLAPPTTTSTNPDDRTAYSAAAAIPGTTARITAAQAFAQVASARKTRSALSKRPTLVSRMRAEAIGDADGDADSCSDEEEEEEGLWEDEFGSSDDEQSDINTERLRRGKEDGSPSSSRLTLPRSSREMTSRTPDSEKRLSAKKSKVLKLDCYSDPALPERKKLRPCSPRSLRMLRTRSEASLRAADENTSTSGAAIEIASEPSFGFSRAQTETDMGSASLSIFRYMPSPLFHCGLEGTDGSAGKRFRHATGEEEARARDAGEDGEEHEVESMPPLSSPAARLSASQRSAHASQASTLPALHPPTDAVAHNQRADGGFRIKTKRALPEYDYYAKFKREEGSPSPPDHLHVKGRKRQRT